MDELEKYRFEKIQEIKKRIKKMEEKNKISIHSNYDDVIQEVKKERLKWVVMDREKLNWCYSLDWCHALEEESK